MYIHIVLVTHAYRDELLIVTSIVVNSTTPEAVCCCLQTCNFGFDMRAIYTVPVDQVLPPDKLTQASYKL